LKISADKIIEQIISSVIAGVVINVLAPTASIITLKTMGLTWGQTLTSPLFIATVILGIYLSFIHRWCRHILMESKNLLARQLMIQGNFQIDKKEYLSALHSLMLACVYLIKCKDFGTIKSNLHGIKECLSND
jgi:hypothetical protein